MPPERVVDPGGRDGCRAPIPWTPAPATAGRPTRGCRGRPSPGAAASRPQRADAARCCTWRARSWRCAARRPPCSAARSTLLATRPDGVLAYERADGGDRRRVWVNFGAEPAALPAGWVVELATAATDGGLPADGAAILRAH